MRRRLRLQLALHIDCAPKKPVILAINCHPDQLSGGRVEFGLGVGWMKEEFAALGTVVQTRRFRNDEYIEAGAPESGPREFHGEFIEFDKVTRSPRPVNGDIPILVGGDTDVAIYAVNLADGYFPGESDTGKIGRAIRESRVKACDQAGKGFPVARD